MILALLVPGSFGIAFLLAWGLNWLALISWRRSAGQHWTERARLLYPARTSARLNTIFITAGVAMMTCLLEPDFNFLVTTVPAFVGALLGTFPMSRELHPEISFASWLRLLIAILCLIFSVWLVLFLGAVAMPENFGPPTWVIAGTVLLLMTALLFGLGVRLLCRLRLLQPAQQHLQALVAETSQTMRVPVRATWILPTHLSNALALPLTRELIFTDKLLATHPDAEIKAVCAHELGHLSEPRQVRFTRAFLVLALAPAIFIKPLESLGYNLLTVLGAVLIGILILCCVAIRLGRRMEKRADKIATGSECISPGIYARALERLYQTNQMPAVMPRRSNKIHPDLYDRMLAAGVTPDFPKPKPPRRLSWTSFAVLAGFFGFPISFVFLKTFWITWNTMPRQ